MIHIRSQIRDAIAEILGKADSWKSVHKSRIQSPRQIWPYLMVYTVGESDEILNDDDPIIYSRSVEFLTVGMLKIPNSNETQSIEDSMDILAIEVESKLNNTTLRAELPNFQKLNMISTELDVIVTEDGEITHAEVTIKWNIECASSEYDPSTLL